MSNPNLSPVKEAFARMRNAFFGVGVFSLAINLFMLTGPLFMLQVYDRVLASGSIPTLLVLYGLVVVLYGFLAGFTFLRSQILSRIGYRVDEDLMLLAEKARIGFGLSQKNAELRPVADLSRVRQFVASPVLAAFFDLPWAPLYLAVVFVMHAWLGWLTLAGIIIITSFTVANEALTNKNMAEANGWDLEGTRFSEVSHRNAEVIVSMGMMQNILQRWRDLHINGLSYGQSAGNVSEGLMSASKAFRLLLQSSLLGLGAFLAIGQEISPGVMIAASIIGGRALAPIDQIVGGWRNVIAARQSYRRLSEILAGAGQGQDLIELPAPEGYVALSNVLKSAPTSSNDPNNTILQGIEFSLKPGDALGVIGPSASGKSSLARLLVGLWLPDRGSMRLDGATLDQWDRDELGKHIGYLPQSVELMRGTIKENIARFDPEASDEDVVAAAKLANVHDLILGVHGGYSAKIGTGETVLSGGQIQRIALARALYGDPTLIVLDEPNSNLDSAGDEALTHAIQTLRERGKTIVIMAHRPSAIAAVNLLLMLQDGQQVDFGPKADVLKRVTVAANKAQPNKIGSIA